MEFIKNSHIFGTLAILYVFAITCSLTKSAEPDVNPSGSTGEHSSVADTTANVEDGAFLGENTTCPGDCVSIFATFVCHKVLADIDCGHFGLTCCLPTPVDPNAITTRRTIYSTTEKPRTSTYSWMTPRSKSPESTSTTPKNVNVHDYINPPTKGCTGLCMPSERAIHCEAIMNIESLCRSGYRCCVSPDTYRDEQSPDNRYVDMSKLKINMLNKLLNDYLDKQNTAPIKIDKDIVNFY